jgi:hypothetical protein
MKRNHSDLLAEMYELEKSLNKKLKKEKLKNQIARLMKIFGFKPKSLPRIDNYPDFMS